MLDSIMEVIGPSRTTKKMDNKDDYWRQALWDVMYWRSYLQLLAIQLTTLSSDTKLTAWLVRWIFMSTFP